MPKERGITGKVEIDPVDNCLAGVAATAFNLLSKNDKLDGDRLYKLMPTPTHEYLDYIFQVLVNCNVGPVSFKLFQSPGPETEVRGIITDCLDADCLVSLAINSKDWLNDILGIRGQPDRSFHVILIHGSYQPSGNRGNLYLYLSDPYSMKTMFLSWENIYFLIKRCPDALMGAFTIGNLPERLGKYLSGEKISARNAKKIRNRLPNPKRLLK